MQALAAFLSSLPSFPAPAGCRLGGPVALAVPTFGQRFFCAFGSSSASFVQGKPKFSAPVRQYPGFAHTCFAQLCCSRVLVFWRETSMKTSIYSLLVALVLSGIGVAQVSSTP